MAVEGKWARDLPNVAQIYCGLWAAAVGKQFERIKGNAQDGYAQTIDALFFVFALRNLVRAGDLVHDTLAPDDFEFAEEALERFRIRCPDLVNARDWLEHFDEYLLGIGWGQKGRRWKTPLRIKLTQTDDNRYEFALIASGRKLTIDLETAMEAAVDLWLDLDQAQSVAEEFGGKYPSDEEDEEDVI